MTTTFKIYFDGGTIGRFSGEKHDWNKNPTRERPKSRQWEMQGGNGYGSWEVCWNGFSKKVSRELFVNTDYELPMITSNSAEYLSLISALSWLNSVNDKGEFEIIIYGDSQLVLNTLSGRYKTHQPHLKSFRDRCLYLLQGYKKWEVKWYRRDNNVRRFGH